MITIITGGSGSGKSIYAEDYAIQYRKAGDACFYIATMQPYGEEGRKRVQKHRAQREGKGFCTIECYQNIGICAEQIKNGIVLLECMSNLVANEMFQDTQKRNRLELENYIIQQIKQLADASKHLIIVTNEVFSDGILYAPETMDYISLLGAVNQALMQMADEVVEVVYSIPVYLTKSRKSSIAKSNKQ